MVEELRNPLIKNKVTGQLVEVNSSPFTVGRALGCDYVTDNKVVSRRHCKLTKTEQGWTLTDLSTNGTIINEGIHLHNGETSAPLKHKDVINIGEFWEFLSRVEPVQQLENVSQEESAPSPGFDEHGVSDEFLLNLAEQVEQQLQNKSKSDKITNKSEETRDNQVETKIDPGLSNINSTSNLDDISSKSEIQIKTNTNPVPSTSKIDPPINETITNYMPSTSKNVLEVLPSPGTSKTESTDLDLKSNENPAAHNLSVSEILPKMSIEPTEACQSKDNGNKKIKIVSLPSSLVSTPGGSLKIVKVQKVTPEQVIEWKKRGMIVPVTSKSCSVASSITNLNTTVSRNQIIDLTNVPVVTVNSLTNLNLIPSTGGIVSGVNSPIPIVSIDSTSGGTNSTINTPTLPVILRTEPNFIHSNITTTAIIPVISRNEPSSIPVIDLSRSESDSIILPSASDANIPPPIPIPLVETDVPVPIQEVEVKSNEEEMEACPVNAKQKIHESQEAGPSKEIKNEQQNQFEEMEDELMCTICANLFIKTVTLGCSHSFCQYCIETWKKKKSDCPICRNKITSTTRTLVLDNVIEKMLETGSEELKQSRKQALEEREKSEKDEQEQQRKKNEEANQRRNTARRGRNNRRGGGNNREANQNNQRNNPPVQQAPPPPTAYINIVDSPSPSPSTTEDEDSETGWEDEYEDDEWYNGRPGAYYGGYGSCYNCGDPGHWANGCPYR